MASQKNKFTISNSDVLGVTVEAFKKAHPEVEVHLYPANHGFNCDHRAAWDAESAKLARERTLAFFAKHLG